MTFTYKTTRTRKAAPKSPQWKSTPELLTGVVLGQKASVPEERAFRAMLKLKPNGIQFQVSLGAPKGMPGWKSLDFLVIDQQKKLHPVQIDGLGIAHKTSQQKNKDKIENIVVDKALKIYNATPVLRVPDNLLQTQAQADATFKRIEMAGWIIQMEYL